jgi:inhibitor of KinA
VGANRWPRIVPAGDSAVLVQFGELIDLEINQQVHALANALREILLPGIGEAVPGYITLLVHYDPAALRYVEIEGWIRENLSQREVLAYSPRQVTIPVVYGGEYGPDLGFVAAHNRLSEEAVVRIHTSREYWVAMMGFTPGFPYLIGMDPSIAAPRLATPRQQIPAGSVGVAGEQTGIYPLESPGGWRIIGRTPARLFDLGQDSPFLLAPGDLLRFVPVADF